MTLFEARFRARAHTQHTILSEQRQPIVRAWAATFPEAASLLLERLGMWPPSDRLEREVWRTVQDHVAGNIT